MGSGTRNVQFVFAFDFRLPALLAFNLSASCSILSFNCSKALSYSFEPLKQGMSRLFYTHFPIISIIL